MKKNKKVTINMKKYIKPKIEIIHAAPAQLMGISQTGLSSNTSELSNASTQKSSDINIIANQDDVGVGDIDNASKRWNDWGDQLWTGYSPW